MARQQPVYFWFVEPVGSHTNTALSELLSAENADKRLCSDGKYHPLWECTADELKYLCKSREDKDLKFIIFSKCGRRGQIRRHYLQNPFRRKKTPPKTAA